jgi:Acyl-coenzyme A synthetases/AMP-(fatty) acid ligases
MGTMEIESALVAKTDLGGRGCRGGPSRRSDRRSICAFVVLKRPLPTGEEAKQIANELRNWVAKEIGPIAKPKDIRFGENLPKTRSGKIMRRLLRSIAKGEAITQDTTTLENPPSWINWQNPLIHAKWRGDGACSVSPQPLSRCLRYWAKRRGIPNAVSRCMKFKPPSGGFFLCCRKPSQP